MTHFTDDYLIDDTHVTVVVRTCDGEEIHQAPIEDLANYLDGRNPMSPRH